MTNNFFNYPKQAILSNYEDVRAKIIEFYQGNKDIISIYEYGSVSAPGVSDLDLIFILNDNISSDENIFNLSNISSFAHDLVADGTVIKMPQNIFENIQFFDNLNFHRIYGKDLSVNCPSDEDDKYIKLASIADWVPERILKLTRIVNSKEINITNALCTLHSFGYSLKYLDNILDFNNQSKKVILKTSKLRGEWHSLDNPEDELIDCINEAIEIGYKRLFDYEIHLRKSCEYLIEDFNNEIDIELELYKNHYLRFTNLNENNYEYFNHKISSYKKYFTVVSNYFYPHFAILASQGGGLSKIMQNKITPYHSIDESILNNSYKANLYRKIGLAQQNADFLKRNNLKTGLIRYGFHF